jgi:hypothetical protein
MKTLKVILIVIATILISTQVLFSILMIVDHEDLSILFMPVILIITGCILFFLAFKIQKKLNKLKESNK